MKQIEYSLIGSCCYTSFIDISEEFGHSDKVLELWNTIPEDVMEFAQWIEEEEFELNKRGVENSECTISDILEAAMKKAITEETYNQLISKVEEHSLFTSFFEDVAIEDTLVKHSLLLDEYDVTVKHLKELMIEEMKTKLTSISINLKREGV